MIISMTGYGRGSAQSLEDMVTAEIKVLNSRYLEIKLRGIELSSELELQLRERLRTSLTRGSVSMTLALEDETGKTSQPVFNKERFEAIDKILSEIQREYGRHIEFSNIATGADLFTETDTKESSNRVILIALDKALKQVQSMRVKEGQALQNDMVERLQSLENLVTEIETNSINSTVNRKEQLEARLKDLLGDLKLDENRMYQEIAILADKYDISEEITRCRSHFKQFQSLLEVDEPVGKRFNFLLQEIGREINTIGSKSNQPAVSKLVIDMKDQVEKMREQVQNVL